MKIDLVVGTKLGQIVELLGKSISPSPYLLCDRRHVRT